MVYDLKRKKGFTYYLFQCCQNLASQCLKVVPPLEALRWFHGQALLVNFIFFGFFSNCAWKVVLTENVASKEETNKINRERRRRKKNKQVEKKAKI
jgi:hypothetical protein